MASKASLVREIVMITLIACCYLDLKQQFSTAAVRRNRRQKETFT
jgi:hypothetical protein